MERAAIVHETIKQSGGHPARKPWPARKQWNTVPEVTPEAPRRGERLLSPPDVDAEVRKIAERHLALLSARALGCAQDGRCGLPFAAGEWLPIDPQTILSSYLSFGSAPHPP